MRFNLSLILLILLTSCQQASPPEQTGPADVPPQPAAAAARIEETDFQSLTLADFTPFQGEPGTWTEEHDEIVCSGIPKGYAYTNESYRNFTLRCEFQFVLKAEQADKADKANTGFMIFIQEPHKVWPASLEVQGRFDEMCSIKSNGGVPNLTIDDHQDVRERVRRPVGEWNSVEIVAKNGELTAFLNGELVCTSQPGELQEGKLGLQSEGFVVRFRNLRVRRDAEPPGPAGVP